MRPDITFYQQYALPYFGILSMAAYLKHHDFKVEVVIDSLEESPIETLKQLNPKVVGITAMSTEHNWLINVSGDIRRALPEATIIVGGVHATFYPEEILSTATAVDLVCHSEGEKVLLNVLSEFNKPLPDWTSIQGLSYRNNTGKVHTNERAQMVPFNDEIFEDRAIYYDRYPQLAQDMAHRFFSSRGCPYRCSFCYNTQLQDAFRGKGTYVRQKSVNNFLQEILLQCERYPIQSIFFGDDLFTFNKKWLKQFLDLYKTKINLPFMCSTWAKSMDEDTARMLSEAGCRTAAFGVESGNYKIRKDILKKNITDDDIIRCGNLLHKYNIKFQTSNMFCLPDETLEDAYKTVELNIKVKTDYAFCALFMPFPDTDITKYCIKQGFLKPDYSLNDLPISFITYSILTLPDKDAIMNVQRLAYFFIQWPWTYKVFKKWVRFSFLDILFHYIFILGNLLRHKEERGISLWSAIRFGWRLRKSF